MIPLYFCVQYGSQLRLQLLRKTFMVLDLYTHTAPGSIKNSAPHLSEELCLLIKKHRRLSAPPTIVVDKAENDIKWEQSTASGKTRFTYFI